MDLSFTRCSIEHLDDLVLLSRQTFMDAFAHLNDPKDFESYLNSAFDKEAIMKEMLVPESTFYFAYCDGHLAGYFKLNRGQAQTDIKDPSSIEIERIYVLQEFQGKKIGQWMLRQIEKIARSEVMEYLWLGVWEINKDAIRFYQSFGFEKFGEHPYNIGNDRQTDWLMRFEIGRD